MNLPVQWTSFVGRDRERVEVGRLLAGAGLLTLAGPGGVGKTRLAIAVAEKIGSRFTDGVAFVDLAPLIDAEAVPHAIPHPGLARGWRSAVAAAFWQTRCTIDSCS